MVVNSEQNGRQPPPQQPAAPPTDPRTRGRQDKICRDFIWGICKKGAQCKFPHELEFESMKEVLKFCHDYQNKPACTRPDCTYLHASSEEQKLFLSTGRIPKVLADRYATMASNLVNGGVDPGPLPASVFVAIPPVQPPPSTASAPLALPALQTLLPPPPPPPVAATPVSVIGPVYTGSTTATPPVKNAPAFPITQQQTSLPFMFDPSRPPPPRPVPPTPPTVASVASKRPADSCEVVPSKVRTVEATKVANIEDVCGSCEQGEISTEVIVKQIEHLNYEERLQSLIYESKLKKFNDIKGYMKGLVSSQFFAKIEKCVEADSTSSEQFYKQLVDMLLNHISFPQDNGFSDATKVPVSTSSRSSTVHAEFQTKPAVAPNVIVQAPRGNGYGAFNGHPPPATPAVTTYGSYGAAPSTVHGPYYTNSYASAAPANAVNAGPTLPAPAPPAAGVFPPAPPAPPVSSAPPAPLRAPAPPPPPGPAPAPTPAQQPLHYNGHAYNAYTHMGGYPPQQYYAPYHYYR